MRHHHPALNKTIPNYIDLNTKKSSEDGVLPTSIENMLVFTAKVKVKVGKLLYWTATATLVIDEGISFVHSLTKLSRFIATTISELQYSRWLGWQLRQQQK
jgi:hypothetical protein